MNQMFHIFLERKGSSDRRRIEIEREEKARTRRAKRIENGKKGKERKGKKLGSYEATKL